MSETATARRRSAWLPGWWVRLPLLVMLVGALFVRLFDESLNDPAVATLLSVGLIMLGGLVYGIWFLVRSGLALITRGALVGGIILVGLISSQCVVITGWTGTLIPEVRWSWAVEEEPAVPHASTIVVVDEAKTAERSFPQYLGPTRNGVIVGPVLATNWTEQAPVMLWRQPIGAGLGGFAIAGDRAITLEQRGPEELAVCYHLQTGAVLWVDAVTTRHQTRFGGTGPRTTPTIHGDGIVVLGAAGHLRHLDLATGARRWAVDMFALLDTDQEADEARVAWGRSGSPLIVDDMVVVPGGGAEGSRASLIAFALADGSERWRGGERQVSYASPMLTTILGQRQIVSVNEDTVTGHDPATGKELWMVEQFGKSSGQASCSQPIRLSEHQLLISKGYGQGSRRIDFTAEGGMLKPVVAWQRPRLLRTKFSSPVPGEGTVVYGMDEREVIGFDTAEGTLLWRGERYGHGQVYRTGDQLLILGERGEVALVDSADGRELCRFQAIDGKTWSTPALVGDLLVVRNQREAACYRLPVGEP